MLIIFRATTITEIVSIGESSLSHRKYIYLEKHITFTTKETTLKKIGKISKFFNINRIVKYSKIEKM